jgi:hypothetical protein
VSQCSFLTLLLVPVLLLVLLPLPSAGPKVWYGRYVHVYYQYS